MGATGTRKLQRARTHFFDEHAMQVALADSQLSRETRDSCGIDSTIADAARCSCREVTPCVPVSRAGNSFGSAALASPEPSGDARRSAREKAAVLGYRFACWARRPAIDTRAGDAKVHAAIPAGVAARDRPIAGVKIELQ